MIITTKHLCACEYSKKIIGIFIEVPSGTRKGDKSVRNEY